MKNKPKIGDVVLVSDLMGEKESIVEIIDIAGPYYRAYVIDAETSCGSPGDIIVFGNLCHIKVLEKK